MCFLKQYLICLQYKKVVKVNGHEINRKTAHPMELCRKRMELYTACSDTRGISM